MDYDLTLRVLEQTHAANVAALLLDYRFHTGMSTIRGFRNHYREQLRARWAALPRGAVPPSESVWLFKSLVTAALPAPIGRWIAPRKLRRAHGRRAA